MSVLDPRRDDDVTASNVPAICGECAFQTKKSVLYKMALRLRSEDNPACAHGRFFEPIAMKKFCEKTGATIIEYPCEYQRHRKYTWLGGTKDGKVKMPNGDVVVVEIKCPVSRPIKDEVPLHYMGQVQTYLYIEEECPYALFVQFKPSGPRSVEKLQITKVERDPGYMALRMPALKRFWDDLQMWKAYVDRIVTVMQRAWRSYLLRKSTDNAAKASMAMRLKCARIVGKIAGFCKTKRAQVGMLVPQPNDGLTSFIDLEDDSRHFTGYRNRVRAPESKRPRLASGQIFVSDD